MIELNSDERIIIIFFLFEIMKADSIIHPAEESYMDRMLERFGISTKELDRLELLDYSYCKSVLRRFPHDKLTYARECFIGMSLSDGFVDHREQKLIDELCSTCGK